FAARHPQRTLSLASIMSTTGSRWKGQPALRVYPFFVAKPPRTKEQYVESLVKLFRVVGSPGFERDDEELREMAALSWDRGPSPAGLGRQLAAIVSAGDRTLDVGRITAPTVVIHGRRDRLVRKSGGKATARAFSDFAVEEGGVGAGTVTRSGARDPPACASTNPSRGTCSPSPTSTPRW